MVFVAEESSTAEPLARRLQERGIEAQPMVLPVQGVDPKLFAEEFRGVGVVGLVIGQMSLPSWVIDLASILRPNIPVVAIWLPNTDPNALGSWPPSSQPTATFDLAKGGQADEEIEGLVGLIRSVASGEPEGATESIAGDGKSLMANAKGVDLSRWQALSDWSPTGLSFVFIRASQGTTPDDKYQQHLEKARAAGLIVGAYATNSHGVDMAAQVAAFAQYAGDVDLYAIDVEGARGRPAAGRARAFSHAQTKEFIKSFRALTGRPIGMYHSESGYFDAGQDFDWVANWDVTEPGRAWDFHQYQGSPLDLDQFNGTAADLRAFVLRLNGGNVNEDVLRDVGTTPLGDSSTVTNAGLGQDAAAATAAPSGLPNAGFRSDEASGDDLFDLANEVDALATVIAARSVEPPLALGLFGDWGTGKTFFMNLLEARIDQMAAKERNTEPSDERPTAYYCTNVVQLRFNAWHYIEQDLWASLASAIFDGLDKWVTTRNATPEEKENKETKRARLLTETARERDELERAERAGDESRGLIEAIDERLQQLDSQHEELLKPIPRWEVVKAVVGVAVAQPGATEAVDGAVAPPGVKEAIDGAQKNLEQSVATLAGAVGTTKEDLETALASGLIPAIREASKNWRGLRRGWRLWLPLTVAVGVAVLLIIGIATAVSSLNFGPALTALTAAITAIGSAAIVVAGWLAYPIAQILAMVRASRAATDKLVADAKRKKQSSLQADRAVAERQAVEADSRAAAHRNRLESLRQELVSTDPKREMAQFIKRRQASDDYRSHLGVVAKARNDFEELTYLLSKQVKVAETPGEATQEDRDAADLFAPIDRIVLYIDDLDRCKEADVVAVLQAVHLLLAFKLFVVVVAVDPRWLLHSLRVTSRVLAGADVDKRQPDDDMGWESTPLNYLEKIFQVPYALQPMGKDGFEALVTNLVPTVTGATNGTNGARETKGTNETASSTVPPGDGGNGNAADTTGFERPLGPTQARATPPPADGLSPANQPASPTATPANGDGAAAATGAREVDLNPAALDITKSERAFMVQLHELIGTPRAAKRFVNVYRLFKASTPAGKRPLLEDAANYQPILILLALLTGFPSEATVILRELLERPKVSGQWLPFVTKLQDPVALTTRATADRAKSRPAEYVAKAQQTAAKTGEAERWADLQSKLARIDASSGPMEAERFQPWASRAARYGFESSRVLATNESAPRREPPREPANEPVTA
jgi:GH25 family lysozyme M1 (1,4-beta-N-acetylmuramidase)